MQEALTTIVKGHVLIKETRFTLKTCLPQLRVDYRTLLVFKSIN
jgi:hypothetical protein